MYILQFDVVNHARISETVVSNNSITYKTIIVLEVANVYYNILNRKIDYVQCFAFPLELCEIFVYLTTIGSLDIFRGS